MPCGFMRRAICMTLAWCGFYPLVSQVRMQLATDSSVSFIGMLLAIVQQEGAAALFKGLKPALLRQASYQGVKMLLYEPIRDAVLAATAKDGDTEPKLWQMILAGGLAGAIGTYLTSPTDLVKIRMQSGVRYDGVIDAFGSVRSRSPRPALCALPLTRRSLRTHASHSRSSRRAGCSHSGMDGRPTYSARLL